MIANFMIFSFLEAVSCIYLKVRITFCLPYQNVQIILKLKSTQTQMMAMMNDIFSFSQSLDFSVLDPIDYILFLFL